MKNYIWYRYPSYSIKRPDCFNGLMRVNDEVTIHIMIHYGKLVQIHFLRHDMKDSNILFLLKEKFLINQVEKISFHFAALSLLYHGFIRGLVLSIKNGEVEKIHGNR